ncbi:MAG TPA: nuclear transport factor 2 family protein, partial [Caulobacteraceae bacterium]|nr:nuclear transport factor 2 family protein [Caulobacteraceae bacterium]
APDARYVDQQVPAGIVGHDALRAYLTGLFAATPPMRYDPEEIWPTPNGFCGRWYCVIGEDPKAKPALRGFDLVVLSGGRIVLNEVYVHTLTA